MDSNPSPEIQVARDAAAKLGDADQVIIITINYAKNQIGAVTYGKTKQLWSGANLLGLHAYAAVHAAIENGDNCDE